MLKAAQAAEESSSIFSVDQSGERYSPVHRETQSLAHMVVEIVKALELGHLGIQSFDLSWTRASGLVLKTDRPTPNVDPVPQTSASQSKPRAGWLGGRLSVVGEEPPCSESVFSAP
jgi:hypothetical protein